MIQSSGPPFPPERSVPLTQILGSRFSASFRRRGEDIVDLGRVLPRSFGPTSFIASISGSPAQQVTIGVEASGRVDLDCTCGGRDVQGLCEHIWATLRMADLMQWRPGASPEPTGVSSVAQVQPDEEGWRGGLAALEALQSRREPGRWASHLTGEETIVYILAPAGADGGRLRLEVARSRRQGDAWQKPRPLEVRRRRLEELPPGVDRTVLRRLLGSPGTDGVSHLDPPRAAVFTLGREELEDLLPVIAPTGRLRWRERGELQELGWDDGDPWRFRMALEDADGHFGVHGWLERAPERRELGEARALLPGHVIFESSVARLDAGESFGWIDALGTGAFAEIPDEQREAFLGALVASPAPPALELPAGWERVPGAPKGRVVVESELIPGGTRRRLRCRVFFDYGDGFVIPAETDTSVAGWCSKQRVVARDFDVERALVRRLLELGPRRKVNDASMTELIVPTRRLTPMVETLLKEGWAVEAEGKRYHQASEFQIQVATGVDWFDVKGRAVYDGKRIPFARLLGELRRGSNLIRLGDGSYGMLPQDWLRRMAPLLALGREEDDGIRFEHPQGSLLDALLAEREDVDTDAGFEAFRRSIQRFEGIESRQEPSTFAGELRPYQRHTLGWLATLRDLGTGGCLADDMGLGKTVQMLAYLEDLRTRGEARFPHLIVAPRSVLGNWLREAARFVPQMTVATYFGSGRTVAAASVGPGDVLVTTYGTLRNAAPELAELSFDTVVLDEAQTIKNPTSQTAKAARVLRARQRIALSGTPIENHLGELWSLFEFLTPGLLGRARAFKRALREEHAVETIARTVRPFILRRTKAQVLPDLPRKTEQTIYCPLGPGQRVLYDELREHYRALLLRSGCDAIDKVHVQVLPALLRLRQAACHPALLDRERRGSASAKLEFLLDRLREIRDGGHQALVFSQFTSLLRLVQSSLEEEGIAHEYLDGQTQDRDRVVRRFQEDPSCTAFLISLKAGGTGLNLTAAEYVFILDPWWNPAVEAQAVDRAHRFGQTKPVFAYRLIAEGTVEQKIVELQKAKRELADAIIREDDGLLKSLTREDLELLLS